MGVGRSADEQRYDDESLLMSVGSVWRRFAEEAMRQCSRPVGRVGSSVHRRVAPTRSVVVRSSQRESAAATLALQGAHATHGVVVPALGFPLNAAVIVSKIPTHQ